MYSSLALLLPFVRSGVARGAFDVSRQPGQGRRSRIATAKSVFRIKLSRGCAALKHPLLQRGVLCNYPEYAGLWATKSIKTWIQRLRDLL